jgi:hypothetical protein
MEIKNCFYCGVEITEDKNDNNWPLQLHRDHYIPKSKGGSNHPQNIVDACSCCNRQKRDMFPDDWADLCLMEAQIAIDKLKWLTPKEAMDAISLILSHYDHLYNNYTIPAIPSPPELIPYFKPEDSAKFMMKNFPNRINGRIK